MAGGRDSAVVHFIVICMFMSFTLYVLHHEYVYHCEQVITDFVCL